MPGKGVHEPVGRLSKLLVLRMTQPAFEVPEGIEIGNEIDEMLLTIILNSKQFASGQWLRIFPNRFMPMERIGVFDIELQLIEFQQCQLVYEGEDGLKCGHLAATNVEHNASFWEEW